MTRKKPWEDFYDVTNVRYVHSYWRNFESIYKKNNIDLSKTKDDSTFQKIIASVFIVLEEQVKEWKNLRNAFITSGVERNIFTSTDPQKALLEWNQMYQKYKKEKEYLGAIHDVMEIAAEYSTIHKKNIWKEDPKHSKAAEKYWNFLAQRMTQALDGFIAINKYIFENHSNAINFIDAEDYDKKLGTEASKQNVSQSVIRAITAINDILKSMGKGSIKNDGLNILKNDLETAKKDLLDTSKPWDQNKFEQLDRFFTLFGRQNPKNYLQNTFGAPKWTDVKGILYETIIEDAFKGSRFIFVPDGGKAAEELKEQTTSDLLTFEFNYKSKSVRGGISLKTTSDGSFNTFYAPQDFIDSSVFQQVENGLSSSNTVQWLRSNILALNTFNLDDETGRLSADGPKATGTTQYLDEFLDLEEYITGLMILPRALDGVYEFQDKITLKEFNGQVVYTALINMKDKFYWVADIAEKLVNSFKTNIVNNPFYKAKAQQERKNLTSFNFSSVSESQLKDFYNKKRAILGKLSSVLYTNISESLKAEIDELYRELGTSTPISKIGVTLNYKKLV